MISRTIYQKQSSIQTAQKFSFLLTKAIISFTKKYLKKGLILKKVKNIVKEIKISDEKLIRNKKSIYRKTKLYYPSSSHVLLAIVANQYSTVFQRIIFVKNIQVFILSQIASILESL